MALLKTPSKQPKTTTLQVRLDQEVRHNLDKYAAFIDASPSYVVSEALKLLFKKDADFRSWVDRNTRYQDQEKSKGEVLTKTA